MVLFHAVPIVLGCTAFHFAFSSYLAKKVCLLALLTFKFILDR